MTRNQSDFRQARLPYPFPGGNDSDPWSAIPGWLRSFATEPTSPPSSSVPGPPVSWRPFSRRVLRNIGGAWSCWSGRATADARSWSAAAGGATSSRPPSSPAGSSPTPPPTRCGRSSSPGRSPEQRRFFEEEAGIPLALEPETGKLFPVSNSAREVRDGLMDLARRRGVEIRFDVLVEGLRRRGTGGPWTVRLAGGETIPAAAGDPRDRRAVLAGDGERRHRSRDRPPPRPHDPSDLSGPDAADRRSAPHAAARRHLARRDPHARPGRADRARPTADSSSPTAATAARRCSTSPISRCAPAWPADRRSLSSSSGRSSTPPPGTSAPARGRGDRDQPAPRGTCRTASPRRSSRTPESTAPAGSPSSAAKSAGGWSRLLAAAIRCPGPATRGTARPRSPAAAWRSRRSIRAPWRAAAHPGLFLCGEILDAFGPIGGYNFLWAWATGRAAGLGCRWYIERKFASPSQVAKERPCLIFPWEKHCCTR